MDSWVVPPLAIVNDAPPSTWVQVSDSIPLQLFRNGIAESWQFYV